MGRRIALLRGINVGRAKRVAMADLRRVVAGLGYTNVRTLLNSGNVVFDVPNRGADAAERIEAAVAEELGVSARVAVISADALDAIVAENPLVDLASNPSLLLVAIFVESAARRRLEPLTREEWGAEAVALGSRAAYFWCPNGSLESRALTEAARLLGDNITTRNWRTILKLQALAADD